jgi:V/A-type H+/Na+-transporting ATPase subunit I
VSALRVSGARWFELLTSRKELGRALRALARTGRVQLEAHSDVSLKHLLPALRAVSDEYRRLEERYGAFWPAAAPRPIEVEREPDEAARAALEQLRRWALAADPTIDRLQQLATARAELDLLRDLLLAAQADAALPNLARLGQAGPILATRAYRLAPGARALAVPASVLTQRFESSGQSYLLAVGPSNEIAALDETLSESGALRFALPAWLPADRQTALAKLATRREQMDAQSQALNAELAHTSNTQGVSAVRADLEFVDWLVEHVPELPMTEHFAWITGWTSDSSDTTLRAGLDGTGFPYLLRFPAAPAGLVAPVVLRNPRWARPFELFARLLGTPAATEADPSLMLALIAPLLFGFMFGDVAQGAVLLITGLLLRRRYPGLALLIPGGAAAIAFGFLFGSILAREDILPALWVKPLARPLTLLRVSLALGSAIILIGLALEALQQWWSHQARHWCSTRAGLVFAYLGIVASIFDRRTLWALPAGLAWCCAGATQESPRHRLKALADAVIESLETLLQLGINTLSFVRVGAFALAHAGLASAVVALASAVSARPLSWALLLLGNALMVVLETLVAGIQTTRLVLFEFFIRFLHGSGRPFQALPSPDTPRSAR